MTSFEPCPLLIGYSREGTFAHLVRLFEQSRTPCEVLDLNAAEECRRTAFNWRTDSYSAVMDEVRFELVGRPIFYRGFFRQPKNPGKAQMLRAFINELESALELLPNTSLVINRPGAGLSNSSKFKHLAELAACGFSTPRTILSTVPSSTELAVAPNHAWINKGCSGVRTMAASVGGVEAARLHALARCPSLFQEHVRGFDVRVHVVCSTCVALRIDSNRVDYRYAKRQGGTIDVAPIDLPALERFRALEYMRRAGLNFAGFDFKVDKDAKWWILEANPMPGFEFFDQFAGNAIGHAVRSALCARYAPLLRSNAQGGLFIESDRVPAVDQAN